MARITISSIKTQLGLNETYDIVNAIRNESGTLSQYTPLASAENVAEFGKALNLSETTQNEFISALINRIGLTLIRTGNIKNTLKKFKTGSLDYGKVVQETYTDIIEAQAYDMEESVTKLYEINKPDVSQIFHEENRRDFYPITVSEEQLKKAFVSWDDFGAFLASIMQSVINSAERDEYLYTRLLMDNYFAAGKFTVVSTPEIDGSGLVTKQFIKAIRTYATKMSLPTGSRGFNAQGVMTSTPMENIHLFITPEIQSEIDVDVLAAAFNMGKADFMGNVTVIDEFGSTGIQALMVDEEFFRIYDTNVQMKSQPNARGLYWNYFYHVWQVLSANSFANAIAFVKEENFDVYNVIVKPTGVVSLAQGASFKFSAIVRAINNTVKHKITWSISGNTSTNTKISVDGNITMGSDEKSKLITVKATVIDKRKKLDENGDPIKDGVTQKPTIEDVEVIGEGVVTTLIKK